MDTLVLSDSAHSLTSVNVHPVVLLSVLDQHLRRNPGQDRAVGVLLGTVANGVVEVTNSFGVFHVIKGAEVLVARAPVLELLSLHRRCNPKEVIVGWYSTATGDALVDDPTTVLHSFFAEMCARPVHLVVDTRLATDNINVHAYVQANSAAVRDLLTTFEALPTTIVATPEERVGIDAMLAHAGLVPTATGSSSSAGPASSASGSELTDVVPDVAALEASMRRLQSLLDASLAYVEDVAAGKRPADETIGRAIADTLAAVPTIDAASFEASFSGAVQDLLMVSYLASITNAQMKLAERIASSVPQRR